MCIHTMLALLPFKQGKKHKVVMANRMQPINAGTNHYRSKNDQLKTQEEVIEIVKSNMPQRFKKFGTFKFEVANTSYVLYTIINGVCETTNNVNPGDYVVTGPLNEQFALKPETFRKRYRVVAGNVAEAIGECFGAPYIGKSFNFTAPWGELTLCENNDYLVSPDDSFSSAYRIEAEAFAKTYRPVSQLKATS